MKKMNKLTIAVRIKPETRAWFEKTREETGIPVGILIDKMVQTKINEENGQVKAVVYGNENGTN